MEEISERIRFCLVLLAQVSVEFLELSFSARVSWRAAI